MYRALLTAAAVSLTALAATATAADASATVPVTITGFTASVDPQGTVSVAGCIDGVPVRFLRVQYATASGGPWSNLADSVQAGDGTCAGTGFHGTAHARVPWAYYRVSYAGGSSGGTTYLPGTSRTVLAWKYQDRIASFKAQRHGSTVTVSGQLQYYYSGWHAYAGQRVGVVYEPQGGNKWYWHIKPVTSKSGRFTGTMTYPRGAHWGAYYQGSSTHFATGTGQAWIGG